MKMRKTQKKIKIKKNVVKKMMQTLKHELKEIMITKTKIKKDKNTMKIITEAVILSIIMKKDQMMAVKITIKEDM